MKTTRHARELGLMDEVRRVLARTELLVWVVLASVVLRYVIALLKYPQMWRTFLLSVVWCVGAALGLRWVKHDEHPGRLMAVLASVGGAACLFLNGSGTPPQVMPAVVSVVLISLLWRWRGAIVGTLLMSVGAFGVLVATQTRLPDGVSPWVLILPILAPCLFGTVLRVSLLATSRAEEMARELERTNRALKQSLSAADELVAARERARMARELHDSIGHAFTIGSIQLDAAQRLLDRGDRASVDEALAVVQESMKTGLEELRSCVTVLREDASDRTLAQQARALVEGASHTKLQIDLEVQGEERRLPTSHEFTCFRVLQESLTNIARHASATSALVTLRYDEEGIWLHVCDDGIGAPHLEPGYGMRGLMERVHMLSGELHFDSLDEGGFEVKMRLPRRG